VSDAGRHNDNLEIRAAEILSGGTWKHQRAVCIMPAGKAIPFRVAAAMRGLITPPNQAFAFLGAEGMEVGEAYTRTIEHVLADPNLSTWEYILTVEHDNLPPPDGFLKLIKAMEAHPEYAAIGGLYWTKGEGGVPQIWGDPKDPVLNFRAQPPKPGEIVECCGTGQGFTLFRMSMFKDAKLRKPWFRTLASAEEGVGTQDLHFWGDARKHGYRCAVDCSVLVGHLDPSTGTVW
jgi:hypothetical protein